MKLERIIAKNNRLLALVNKQLERKQQSLELAKRRIEKKNQFLALTEARLVRNRQFLELYKNGMAYKDIAAKYKLSLVQFKRIIKEDVEFQYFLKEQQDIIDSAKKSKEEIFKEKLLNKNLLKLHPEKIKILWDYEKNEELLPENVLAKTTKILVWFKCPIDGHSWQKNPSEITRGWIDNGRSGCAICANKFKKNEKRPSLTEIYPELVEKYWDYKKNDELGLYPNILTLSSNKEAWFKCPIDGNEWKIIIGRLVHQQWSRANNTGCRVCNGTIGYSRSQWQHQAILALAFPDRVAKYWLYEANDKIKLNPNNLTIKSGKKAWLRCPIDGHEWQASISLMTKAWENGNTGCGACQGLIAMPTTSIASLYPDNVAKYWNYARNNAVGLYPANVTKGSGRDVWLKCPNDGHEWQTKIFSITRSWSSNRSGCPNCAKRNK